MQFPNATSFLRTSLLLLVFLPLASVSYAQKNDSSRQVLNFKGSIGMTNNGFSLVPTFTLGKPALVTIFNVSGKSRLSFEPEFRYSLEDFKPWSFIFIWRFDAGKARLSAFHLVFYEQSPSDGHRGKGF